MNSFKVIETVWILSSCIGVILGYQQGPSYRLSDTSECTSDSNCPSDTGQICWWLYEGCSRGICMCDPRTHIMGNNRQCQRLLAGGEACTSRDICATGMHCTAGFCQCKTGHMTEDRLFCQSTHNKLLGERCSQSRDHCWQKSAVGYTQRSVECSYKEECRCMEGYKQDGLRCRKWWIYEEGCSENHHCKGGALCVGGVCKCPTGYHSVARNAKCAKNGAIYNLPNGSICDEINEKRYCGYGLLCHQCSNYGPYKCVRYQLSDGGSHLNSALNTFSLSTVLFLAVIFRSLYILTCNLRPLHYNLHASHCSNAGTAS